MTIDVVQFKDTNQPAISPVTIWIGVKPESLSAMAAHYAAQDVLALLKKHDITDIDVDFRELIYSRAAGPQLLKPVNDLDPLVNVVSPLTPTLGLSISTKARLHTQGTMALYLVEGGDSEKLLGLSCRHVLIASEDANINYHYHKSASAQDVLLLSKKAVIDFIDSIKLRIGQHAIMADRWRTQIRVFKEMEKGTGAADVANARAAQIETQVLLDKVEAAMNALEAFHNQVNNWKNPNNRVLGHILCSPAICLGVSEEHFTEDWGIFEVERAKLGEGFKGNVMDLGVF